jgi:alkanesulfonate monooxygenase SsuD/methylene tetrahydromethanopterin reductase-like flavin-dependent oxidoreductase (luciferase family)
MGYLTNYEKFVFATPHLTPHRIAGSLSVYGQKWQLRCETGEGILEFGIQFFPSVGPAETPADRYWSEALYLTQLAEQLGYTSVRTVEHYFHSYGGYSPSPLVFLSAAAAVTQSIRLITGAVLPVFNNPLKLAGEIGMVDAISRGRLEVGFARAFLPHEFARFGISMDESRARFEEGLDQVRRLLEEERVTSDGNFHAFKEVTSLPRPTQKPRPPFWVAALSTTESFETCGRRGDFLMAIPLVGSATAKLLALYRNAWTAAGHPGRGKVMLAFNMFCAPNSEAAVSTAKPHHTQYLNAITSAAAEWRSGISSRDYPNYQKMFEALAAETFESSVEKRSAWIGTPHDIRAAIAEYDEAVGGFDAASLQVNFGALQMKDAEASMRLFASEVMPYFANRLGARVDQAPAIPADRSVYVTVG